MMPTLTQPPRSDADMSAVDIAIEDAASDLGIPFTPGPPPPAFDGASVGGQDLLGVAILDRELRYRRIDPALAAINGVPPEDHVGRTLAEVLPELAEAVSPAHRRVVETGEPLLSVPVFGRTKAAPRGRRWLASYFPLPPTAAALAAGRDDPAGLVAVVREVDEELTARPRGVSDEQFRELVTQATVGLAQVDPAGRFLYVNDRYCAITGWSREELVGARRERDLAHPHDDDARTGRGDARFARALRTGEPYLTDRRLLRPDGRSVWVRNTVTVLPGADGRPDSLFVVAVDVTDRHRTERALARSERRLRLAAEAGRVGVWAFDLKKGVADWSPEALAMYGGFDGRPTMAQLRDRVHPDDRDRLDHSESFDPPGGGPARVDITHRVVFPDSADTPGAVRWVRALGERWFDEGGRPLRSVGVLRDVTDERAAADRLADSERRLRLALDAADVGTFEYDPATGRARWDARLRRFLGRESGAGRPPAGEDEEVRIAPDGGEMLAVTHPADRAAVAAAFAASQDPAGDGRYDLTHRVARPDGAVRWLHTQGETRFVGEGAARRPAGTSGTVRDVTAEHDREARLRLSEERLRLAARAARLGAYSFDLKQRIVWWDERARALLGAAEERTSFEDAGRTIHPADRPAVRAAVEAAADPAGTGRLHVEFRVRRPGGPDDPADADGPDGDRWVRSMGEMLFDPPPSAAPAFVGTSAAGGAGAAGGSRGARGPAARLIGYLQDVTEEKRAEQALAGAKGRLERVNDRLELSNDRLEREVAARTAQLRTAAERLAEAARLERDRIAHVLHDHLQQILVGAKMHLSLLHDGREGEDADVARRAAELIQEAIGESRTLSAELSPPVLRSAGLCPALSWLTGQFRTRHELEVTLDCDAAASDRLTPSVAALLFGAAREALLNVVKHSGAGSARLTFGPTDAGETAGGAAGEPAVRLTVADDGAGFVVPPDDAAPAGDAGFGMSDLRQQVDLLGGTLTLTSAPGAGCTVAVRLPLPGDGDGDGS